VSQARDPRPTDSIRVNDQYRVCSRWTRGGAEDVEIVDDH
jgi:proteic killer suppression protein